MACAAAGRRLLDAAAFDEDLARTQVLPCEVDDDVEQLLLRDCGEPVGAERVDAHADRLRDRKVDAVDAPAQQFAVLEERTGLVEAAHVKVTLLAGGAEGRTVDGDTAVEGEALLERGDVVGVVELGLFEVAVEGQVVDQVEQLAPVTVLPESPRVDPGVLPGEVSLDCVVVPPDQRREALRFPRPRPRPMP